MYVYICINIYMCTYTYKHDNLWSLQMSDGWCMCADEWCMCADEPSRQAHSAYNHMYLQKMYSQYTDFVSIFSLVSVCWYSSHLPCCSWPVVVYV